MKNKIQKLKKFIEKFGVDFLKDGTKAEIIKQLDSGDAKFALEILETMDFNWIK